MKTAQSRLSTTARMFLGAILLVSGANGFLQFMPMPPMPAAAGQFLAAMAMTGYLVPLIMGTKIAAGAMLVSGRFVPLALALIAPVLVNMVAFHMALAPLGLAVPLVLMAAEIYLAWSYRDAFAPMLQARPKGAASSRMTGEPTLAPVG